MKSCLIGVLTMEPLPTRFAEEGFLLTAIWDVLAVFGDVTDWVHLVLSVFGCDVTVLILAWPVLDFFLWLSHDEGRFIFAQLLLPEEWHACRYFRGV